MTFTSTRPLFALRRFGLLSVTTALVSFGQFSPLGAQDCAIPDGTLEPGCTHTNAGTAVTMPTQPNVELEDIPELGVDGFEISVDGDPVALDGTVKTGQAGIQAKKRRQDLALAAADVAVKFDGLDVRPRLDIGTTGTRTEYPAGSSVTFRNTMNYPAFVRKGEVRIIDQAARGGDRTVAVIPLNPNASASTVVPEGEGLVYVYRVYDERGRYDETAPASLGAKSRRGLADDVEEGTDATARRAIPVFGGAVTVSGKHIRQGSTVRTLGEVVRPDADGDFVMQRILPTGDHTVSVDVAGGPNMSRDIEVPAADLFYIGLIDITLGKSLNNELEDATGEPYDETYQRGRAAFYLKGKIKGDYLLTAAADTGEDDLENLFKNLDEKNPRSLLDRIDPDEYYPVYGDDSTAEIDAPTSGKLYVRLEKDDSHVMWGNFRSEIKGTEYLRNERTLYGAQGVWRSPATTSKGQAKVEAQVYAAHPETLPQRDVFLGTGGSSYFLKYQDITRGSETLLVEVQNPITGQVIERRTLVYGVDYDINYVQGLVILKRPLSGSAVTNDLVVNNPNGDNKAFLVANYEHTPTATDVDAFSYGGRIQVWANDNLRFGVTAMSEDLGTAKQDSEGFDILYQVSERTFAEFEVAQTEGTGTAIDQSLDGGLTLNTLNGAVGTGRAVRFKGQADLVDLGFKINGVIGGYFEDRGAGFSTLNHRVTNDETLWGIHAEFDPSERLRVRLAHDDYEDSAGKVLKESAIEVAYQKSDTMKWEIGGEYIEQVTPGDPTETGERIDAAVRLTYTPSSKTTVYGYAQATLKHSGGLSKNNRLGIGAERQVSDNWRLSGEISDGSTGIGARALATYESDDNNSSYFGYTLDPDREFGSVDLTGRDKGSFVVGARRKLNESLNVYGENTYDLFGEHKSLTSTYGADYAATDYLTFTGGLEVGRVSDPINNTSFDRTAVSLGSIYRDDQLSLRSKIEYRLDEGITTGTNRDADTIAASVTARYKINEESRLLFSVEGVKSANAAASIPDAKYIEGTLGYALRPIDNDKLNVLAKYTYLYDMTERVAANTSTGANFLETPRQRAHIVSLDASYDLNNHFTLGGKVGGRWSQQDTGAGFVSNNATLGIVNLRYHVVHNWDALLEVRQLTAQDLGTDTGVLAAVYRHVGNNAKIGIGYNFGQFSDDLRDVTYNDEGVFLNIIAKF